MSFVFFFFFSSFSLCFSLSMSLGCWRVQVVLFSSYPVRWHGIALSALVFLWRQNLYHTRKGPRLRSTQLNGVLRTKNGAGGKAGKSWLRDAKGSVAKRAPRTLTKGKRRGEEGTPAAGTDATVNESKEMADRVASGLKLKVEASS